MQWSELETDYVLVQKIIALLMGTEHIFANLSLYLLSKAYTEPAIYSFMGNWQNNALDLEQ